MKFSKKIIIVLLFVIGIAGLLVGSIAYYRIVVNGSIAGSTGNAVFVLRDTEAGESWNNKVISLGQINPGDSGSFDVVMDASGSTVDMYATLNIDRGSGDTELPTNLKFYTTSDHKSELHKYYSFLEKSGTNKETLTIYWYWNPYISDEEDNKYVNKSFSANITVNAVQISEYATMKNGINFVYDDNGKIVDANLSEFWTDNYKLYIRTINFGNDLSNLPSTCNEENLCWDISESPTQKKKVYGYLVDTGLKDKTDNTKALYNLYIVSEAPIFAPSNCRGIFSFSKYENNKNISNLTQINFNNNFNTSNVTDMSYMFGNCSSLTSLDLSNFNTANVTNMEAMFTSCESLTTLDISNFNTTKVTDMYCMFNVCSTLTSLDLSNFNTINVTNMSFMFSSCSSLTSLDLSSFNTANVTDMSYMLFCSQSSLTNIDLSNFNTSNVIDMHSMFSSCRFLTSLDLSNFNTSNVTDMSFMFEGCSSLTNLDISSFNTSNVTDMSSMFKGCSSLTSLDISSFNTSNVTDMYCMFYECKSLTALDLSNFNTANVTNMGGMFWGCSSLEKLNLSNFDTSKVEIYYQNFKGIFQFCTKLQTEITIMNPNVTEENYKNMFYNAATDPNAKIIVNYTSETETLVDNMIKTKSSNSNVVKGILK